jgi:hypothetical protein
MAEKKLPPPIQNLADSIEKKNLKISFGLEQQGHIPTIEKILNEFASARSEYLWEKIGKEIGWDSYTAMRYYLEYLRKRVDQFRWVETTCGKRIEFDDSDYEVLRQQKLFYDNSRNCVMAVWKNEEGKKIVAPIAKLMMDLDGKTVIHYKDGNPLNLKRENIDCITKKVSHQKQKKQSTSSGLPTTSIYKGVSWSKFANKWSAYIKMDDKKKHLGYFTEEIQAAKTYNEAAKEIWGENYSNLNKLD